MGCCRKRKTRALTILLASFLLLSLSLVSPVKANPDTETLYVDSFDQNDLAWSEIGDSPYLWDTDADYIYTNVANALEGYFGFADTTFNVINSVTLYAECKYSAVTSNYIIVYEKDEPLSIGAIFPSSTSYDWYSFDVTEDFPTQDDINNALIYFKFMRVDNRYIYIRRCYLYVDGSAGGNNYVVELSLSITSSLTSLQQLSFQITPAFTPSLTISSLTQTSFILDLNNPITIGIEEATQTSFNIVIVNPYNLDLTKTTQTDYILTLLHQILTSLSCAATYTSATPPTEPPPTYSFPQALAVLFTVSAEDKAIANCTITLYETAYNSYVDYTTTDNTGRATLYLYPGRYLWIAKLDAFEKNGTFLHYAYDTIAIDFTDLLQPKPIELKIVGAVLLVGILVGAIVGVVSVQKGKKWKLKV